MNTSRPGSAEDPTTARRGAPWRVIVLGVIVLGLALVIGTQVIGVLYSIIAPPAPPLPDGVVELEHVGVDYGVDEWLYGADLTACEVVGFYETQGGTCRVVSGNCQTPANAAEVLRTPQHVAQCTGRLSFSIFAQRWDVVISTGYPTDGLTHFRLSREIFWTGSVPPRPEY